MPRARRTLAPGRAVHRALTWDAADRRDPRWWPQGISTSADASDTEEVEGAEGRRVLVKRPQAPPRGRPRIPGVPGRAVLPLNRADKLQVYEAASIRLAPARGAQRHSPSPQVNRVPGRQPT